MDMWQRSELWRKRQRFFAEGDYLLGEKGYNISPFVMRPLTDAEASRDSGARAFNAIHASARVCVERTIGQWKARFRILKGLNMRDMRKAKKLALVTACLHNWFLKRGDNTCLEEEEVEDEAPEEVGGNGEESLQERMEGILSTYDNLERDARTLRRLGQDRRSALMQELAEWAAGRTR